MSVEPDDPSPSNLSVASDESDFVSRLLEEDTDVPRTPSPDLSAQFGDSDRFGDSVYLLHDWELYWRNHYDWFLEQGYRLRRRYKPDWVPSWRLGDWENTDPDSKEDSLLFTYSNINDAIRISDNKHVVLKRILRSDYPEELSILDYFSQEPLASQPENHVIPLLEVLHPPGDTEHDVAVFPILREYDNPEFDTIGEAVDFIHQLLEGFAFLHEHRVAHRDVKVENVMMDPEAMGFDSFHFCDPQRPFSETSDDDKNEARPVKWKFTRTEHRPRYYIIDFGYSNQYTEDEMPPSELPVEASDKSLPELKEFGKSYNPFPIDVYYVGNLIRMDFLDGHENNMDRNGRFGFEFLRPLVEDMIKDDPDERITMKDALETFDAIVATLDSGTLRSRVVPIPGRQVPAEGFIETITRTTSHWYRRVKYITKQLPPIPSESSSCGLAN